LFSVKLSQETQDHVTKGAEQFLQQQNGGLILLTAGLENAEQDALSPCAGLDAVSSPDFARD
jgi:hypothetical protein